MLALEQQQFKSDDEVQPWHWPDQHPVTCVGPGNGGWGGWGVCVERTSFLLDGC